MYKLDTSIDTKIVSLPMFVFSMKLMKSVVSLVKDFCFCAIDWSNVSTNEDISSVVPKTVIERSLSGVNFADRPSALTQKKKLVHKYTSRRGNGNSMQGIRFVS